MFALTVFLKFFIHYIINNYILIIFLWHSFTHLWVISFLHFQWSHCVHFLGHNLSQIRGLSSAHFQGHTLTHILGLTINFLIFFFFSNLTQSNGRLSVHFRGHTLTHILRPTITFLISFNFLQFHYYEGGSICNGNPCITPSTNTLGFYAICQTKDQSVAIIMVHKTSFYISKFNKLETFYKAH